MTRAAQELALKAEDSGSRSLYSKRTDADLERMVIEASRERGPGASKYRKDLQKEVAFRKLRTLQHGDHR